MQNNVTIFMEFAQKGSLSDFLDKIQKGLSIDDGIAICVNNEHPEKALFLIEASEEGIVICVNDEHPEKVESPIEVTEEGMSNVICVNDEHSEKGESPIEVTDDGIVIWVNDEQLEKHNFQLKL